MLFIMMLLVSTLMSLSSNNWLGSWMGLEINLIVFIPLIHTSLNYYSSESSMKYFIIQSMSSSLLLLGIILMSLKFFDSLSYFIIMCGLMAKLGMAPFHMWLPSVMEGISWFNCMLLSTWQKFAVLMLISYVVNNLYIFLPVILSLMIGSIGGLNQSSMKKLMSYSSINNMGWITMSMLSSMFIWMNYFIIYSFMVLSLMILFNNNGINYLNQCFLVSFSSLNKYFISSLMFSLGGLPPLLGFMPKWMVIQSMIFSMNYFIVMLMILTSLLTLFYYIRISMKMILVNSIKFKWMQMNYCNQELTYFLCFSNLLGFILIIFLKSFY
uniref:NADH-ubiquinone oxidoreductase chain 2 n=1 Tax=Peuceptyelus minutus TaxID=2040463 RepID=A0A343KGM5_9HEMI|nr:NADH dehydrogenase subunit 2 [Peuceptyelus minutus]